MKIAFDVKGTLDGHHSELVLKLFKGFQAKGYKCTVWSNMYSFAIDAIKKYDLKDTEPEQKYSLYDAKNQERPVFDLAIEDDPSQTYLAATRIILVRDLNEMTVDALINAASIL